VLVPMALSDHEGGRKELNVSGRSLRNYSPTVKRRTTKFAMVTLVGEGHVSRELDTPAPPKLLGPLTDEARFFYLQRPNSAMKDKWRTDMFLELSHLRALF